MLCALIVPNGFSSAFAEDAVLERSSLGDDGVAYAAEWGNLIGTVEVSYDQSTRTKSLTLNSPLVRGSSMLPSAGMHGAA